MDPARSRSSAVPSADLGRVPSESLSNRATATVAARPHWHGSAIHAQVTIKMMQNHKECWRRGDAGGIGCYGLAGNLEAISGVQTEG